MELGLVLTGGRASLKLEHELVSIWPKQDGRNGAYMTGTERDAKEARA